MHRDNCHTALIDRFMRLLYLFFSNLNFNLITGNAKAAKILLENGATPNIYNKEHTESALKIAFSTGMLYSLTTFTKIVMRNVKSWSHTGNI